MKAIPAGRRDKKKFRDAPDLLGWVLDRFDYRRQRGFTLSGDDPNGTNRVLAMVALMRAAAGHARTILAISRRGAAESGFVNLRAMLELWADFKMLGADRSNTTFRKMYVAGALAILHRGPDARLEARILSEFPEEFPERKKKMEKQPSSHWSGRSRKSTVIAQCGEVYGKLYEILSWDSHPVVQIVLDFEAVEPKRGRIHVRHRESQHIVATNNCTVAAHIIRDMWNELHERFPDLRPSASRIPT